MHFCRIHPILWLIALALAYPVGAQVIRRGEHIDLTLEGYVNTTAVFSESVAPADRDHNNDLRVDAALRALARWRNPSGPDVGVRAVIEGPPENHLRLAEASLLIFGKAGRLEIGERPGLPGVLTGYAPNSFAFTGREFGPASGPSLDPGGGLQHTFLSSNYPYEKCYGIVKAGLNDCFTASNSCAGTVEKDNLPAAWIYVPKGTCKKITDGTTEAPK